MRFIENEITELKRELNESLEKEVVAFLNSKGGDIYIGVSDDGSVCGVSDIDKVQLAISDRISNNILPKTLGLFDIRIENIDNKDIIHIIVSSGIEKPYHIGKLGLSPKGCYFRVGAGIKQMDTQMIDQLYASRTRTSLRNIASPRYTDHTFAQLKIYYEESGFIINDQFLKNLDLYTEGNKLNYVAYLLADTNSVSFKVAKYAGIDKCELIENEEYGYCSIIKATQKVLDKLDIENRTYTKITGAAKRLERRMIDATALREAWINAVVHNDYTYEMAPVVEIYSDRLTITSYGGLVSGLSLEEFYNGRSMPKNRELMRIFRDLELVEQLGSGMHRILKVYDRAIFSISENFLEICFPYTEDYLEYVKSENDPINPESDPVNLENVAIKPENGTINSDDVIVNSEDVIVNPGDVVINPGDVIVNPESDPVNLENGTIKPENVPIKPDDVVINPESDPVNFENVAIKSENGTINSDDDPINLLNIFLEIIRTHPGINKSQIEILSKRSTSTAKRYLKRLKYDEKIEFRGPQKTGGYYIVNSEQGSKNTKKEILELIEKNEGIKIFEIATLLNKSTRTVKRYIKQLRDEEKIKYTGAPKTGGYYIVNPEDDK